MISRAVVISCALITSSRWLRGVRCMNFFPTRSSGREEVHAVSHGWLGFEGQACNYGHVIMIAENGCVSQEQQLGEKSVVKVTLHNSCRRAVMLFIEGFPLSAGSTQTRSFLLLLSRTYAYCLWISARNGCYRGSRRTASCEG